MQGTAAVHIRGRDGSIPSAATTVGRTSPGRTGRRMMVIATRRDRNGRAAHDGAVGFKPQGCTTTLTEVLRSASGEAMIAASTGRPVRSFSANERWVRLPPLRRKIWDVRCAVGATPVSRTGCPPGPGSTPMRSANTCRLTAGQPAYGFVHHLARFRADARRLSGPADAGATPATCSHLGVAQ